MGAMSKFIAEGALAVAECIDALTGLLTAIARLAPLMAEVKIICAIAGMVAIVYRLTEKKEHAIVNASEGAAADKDLIVFVHTGRNDRRASKQFENGANYDSRCDKHFSIVHLERDMPVNGLKLRVSDKVCRDITVLARLVWERPPSMNVKDGRVLCSAQRSSSAVPEGEFAVQFARLPADATFGDMTRAKQAFEDMFPVGWFYNGKQLVAVFLVVHYGCTAHNYATDKLLRFAKKR